MEKAWLVIRFSSGANYMFIAAVGLLFLNGWMFVIFHAPNDGGNRKVLRLHSAPSSAIANHSVVKQDEPMLHYPTIKTIDEDSLLDAEKCVLVSRRRMRPAAYTLRDLINVWPARKTKGLIYILAPPNAMKNLPPLLQNIYASFNARYRYPVVVFSESTDAADILRDALMHFGSGEDDINEVFAYDISELWKVPSYVLERHNNSISELERFSFDSIKGTRCPTSFGLGYKQMCRFQSKTITEIPFIRAFEYILRLDSDSHLCANIQLDLFAFMRLNDFWQGYMTLRNSGLCKQLLTEHIHKFVREYNITPAQGQQSIADSGVGYIYNNFEIFKVDFYLREDYVSFMNYLDRSGGFFYYRWGDALVRTQASRIFMSKEKMYQFQEEEVSYGHSKSGC